MKGNHSVDTRRGFVLNAIRRKQLSSRGDPVLLFIDDEESIIDVLGKCSRLFGYKAYGFTRVRDALRWYQKNADRVDLVCIDMKMPEMNGCECFKEIRAINPKQQVVVMSGFTEKSEVERSLREGALRFFEKPFEIEDFFHWVDDAVAGRARGGSNPKEGFSQFEATVRRDKIID
jgi:DNA-binding NtrC family response regulator